MIFNGIKDLVPKVNRDLGEFCNTFLYTRKRLNNGDRIGKRGILFSLITDKDRTWAINAGGGTEIQYHIAFYDEAKPILLYGLGFNAQYVPFANKLSPVQYILPFAKSFYQIRNKAKSILPHYYYIYGEESQLLNINDGDYILFGNEIEATNLNGSFEIPDDSYNKMLDDLKKQFEIYIETFENRNNSNSQAEQSVKLFSNMKEIKNIILYGPPGTGKTHELKTKYFPLFTSQKKELNQTDFNSRVRQYTWWQVIAATLYNFTEGTTVPKLAESKLIRAKHSPSIEYPDPNHIIWNILQRNPELFEKVENSVWKVRKELIDENFPLIKGLHGLLAEDILDTLELKEDEKENYKFLTFHQSFSYEDFIEGIKPSLSSNPEEKKELNYEMGKGLFYQMCLKALEMAGYESFKSCYEDDKDQRKQKFELIKNDSEKQVAIFIDEINRGNVSSIFGELITLIEDDKRIGAENEIWAELPYSKEKFGVPSNLYIIGTMNTADRSVEALDTALRRRFSFEEMPPKPEVLVTPDELAVEGIDLSVLLSTINKRIEKLVDRDHRIGHSYFINVKTFDQLKETFHNKIIPLLQEYFFGDHGKIGLVLGKGFVSEIEDSDDNLFAEFEYDSDGLMQRKVYQLHNVKTFKTEEFITHLKAIIHRK